jgi:hypothetical protein
LSFRGFVIGSGKPWKDVQPSGFDFVVLIAVEKLYTAELQNLQPSANCSEFPVRTFQTQSAMDRAHHGTIGSAAPRAIVQKKRGAVPARKELL